MIKNFNPLCRLIGTTQYLACLVTSVTNREQGEWMSSSRPSTDHPARSRRPHTRSESRHAEGGNLSNFEFVKQILQEAEEELREIPDLYTDNSSNKKSFDQH